MDYFTIYTIEAKFRFYYLFFSFLITVYTGYVYKEILLFSIVEPLTEILSFFSWVFIFNQFIDLFTFLIYIVLMFSFLSVIPLVVLHFCFFFISGIYFKEICGSIFFLSLVLLNLIMCYLVLFKCLLPFALQYFVFFFIGYDKSWLQYEYMPFLIEYGKLVFFFCGVTVVLFQFPVGLFFYLNRLAFVEKNVVLLRWKVFFLNLLFATFFSPPDLWSQLFLFFLLCCLFEVIIFFFLFKRGCIFWKSNLIW